MGFDLWSAYLRSASADTLKDQCLMSRTAYEASLTIGWTDGQVSHSVIRAEDGTLFRACYYRYELDGSPLAREPDPGRLCRRASCRAQFSAWMRERPNRSKSARPRSIAVTAVLVFFLASGLAVRPTAAHAEPERVQRAAFLVGASSEKSGVVALDEDGNAIGHGKGFGRTVAMAVCPGSARSVEIDDQRRELLLVVRSLPTLSVVRQLTVDRLEGRLTVSCGSASGTDVFGFVRSEDGSGSPDRVVRLDRDGAWSGLWSGVALAEAFSPDGRTAFVAVGPPPEVTVVGIGLSAEQTKVIGVLAEEPSALAVSPDGTNLAVFAPGQPEGQPARTSILPVQGGPPVEGVANGLGTLRALTWSAEDRLTVELRQEDGVVSIETNDSGLKRLGEWAGWKATSTVSRDGALFGLTSSGRLVKADPIAGGIDELEQVGGAGPLVTVPTASTDVAASLRDDGSDEADPEGFTVRADSSEDKGALRLGVLAGLAAALAASAVLVTRRRRPSSLGPSTIHEAEVFDRALTTDDVEALYRGIERDRCSQERPCPERNDTHIALWGECFTLEPS